MYSVAILAFLAVVFLLQLFFSWVTPLFWFNPATVLSTQPWGFVTAIFLHGGFAHLFFNGFALLMFGPYLEQRVGSRKFLELFFAAGIAGSVFYLLFVMVGITPPLPALGASGAIYGILGALAILTPNLPVLIFFFPTTMRNAALFWIAFEFLGTFNTSSGIASAAHLGGLFVGMAYAKFLVRRKREEWWEKGV
ncbi:MAG: rhomboid family intramembrane serine protease [Candidatus Micrarchaeota archaeon]